MDQTISSSLLALIMTHNHQPTNRELQLKCNKNTKPIAMYSLTFPGQPISLKHESETRENKDNIQWSLTYQRKILHNGRINNGKRKSVGSTEAKVTSPRNNDDKYYPSR